MINITLSNRIRHISLSGLIEQKQLIGKEASIIHTNRSKNYFSIIFLGQSIVGKTTLPIVLQQN